MKRRLRLNWWLFLPVLIPLLAGYLTMAPWRSATDKKLDALLADTDRVDVFQESMLKGDWNSKATSLTKDESQSLFRHLRTSWKQTFAFGTVGWRFEFYRRNQPIQTIELQFASRKDAELIFSQPSPYGFPRAVWIRGGWPADFDAAVRKLVLEKTGKPALP